MKELAMIGPGLVAVLALGLLAACWVFDLSGFWIALSSAAAALSIAGLVLIASIGDPPW